VEEESIKIMTLQLHISFHPLKPPRLHRQSPITRWVPDGCQGRQNGIFPSERLVCRPADDPFEGKGLDKNAKNVGLGTQFRLGLDSR
jgi:hypothetical protein